MGYGPTLRKKKKQKESFETYDEPYGVEKWLPLVGFEKTELVLWVPPPKRLLSLAPPIFYNPRKERRGSGMFFSTDSLAPFFNTIQFALATFNGGKLQ